MANSKDRMMMVRTPERLHRAARIKAVESGLSLSEVVRALLRLWVGGEIELAGQEEQPEQD